MKITRMPDQIKSFKKAILKSKEIKSSNPQIVSDAEIAAALSLLCDRAESLEHAPVLAFSDLNSPLGFQVASAANRLEREDSDFTQQLRVKGINIRIIGFSNVSVYKQNKDVKFMAWGAAILPGPLQLNFGEAPLPISGLAEAAARSVARQAALRTATFHMVDTAIMAQIKDMAAPARRRAMFERAPMPVSRALMITPHHLPSPPVPDALMYAT